MPIQTDHLMTNLMMTKHNVAVVITAAGSSTRMGGGVKKEYLPLGEGTVLSNALLPFLKTIIPSIVIITTPVNGESLAEEMLFKDKNVKSFFENNEIPLHFVCGDKTRALSVKAALEKLSVIAPQTEYVLIHDGARPYISESVIKNVLEPLSETVAVTPAITPTDTQKIIDENGFVTTHLVRSNLAAVQTPQGFYFKSLLEAHRKAALDDTEYTDDTEIWQKYCGKVLTVKGDSTNKKITYPEDIKS